MAVLMNRLPTRRMNNSRRDGQRKGGRMRRFIMTIVRDQRFGFLAVGATNTIVGFAIYTVLTLWVFADLRFGYLISLVISYAVAIVLAFVLYRRFVFRVSGHVIRDFLRFVTVYVLSISINLITLPALIEVVGMTPVLAQAVVLIVTTIVSFFGHKSFSFRRPRATRNAVDDGDPGPL
jgi:putative flippase GtrA